MKYIKNRIIKRYAANKEKTYFKTLSKPSIKLYPEQGLVFCELLIDGVLLKLIVDTGSCYNLINSKSPKIDYFINKNIITSREFKAFHESGNMPIIACNVELAGLQILLPFGVLNLDTVLPGIDGLVGYDFLNDFFESLDFANNKLIIKQLN